MLLDQLNQPDITHTLLVQPRALDITHTLLVQPKVPDTVLMSLAQPSQLDITHMLLVQLKLPATAHTLVVKRLTGVTTEDTDKRVVTPEVTHQRPTEATPEVTHQRPTEATLMEAKPMVAELMEETLTEAKPTGETPMVDVTRAFRICSILMYLFSNKL